MRTRIRDQRYGPRYPLAAVFDNAGHGNSSLNPYPSAWVGVYERMDDHNNNPGFKGKGIVMSACKLTRSTRNAQENPKVTVSAYNANNTVATATFSGDFAGYFAYGLSNPLDVDMGNAKQRALIEAYAKMNSSTTLGGEQIATMKQTIGMIRSPFQALTGLAKRARKRLKARKAQIRRTYDRDRKRLKAIGAKPIRFQELAKALTIDLAQAASATWLELRYGMQPLMIDAENHADYIKQKLLDMEKQTVRKVARGNGGSLGTSGGYGGPVGCGLDYVYEPHASASWSLVKRVTAGVVFSVAPKSNLEQLVDHLGLRVRDLPATAWELIPLSFVVDWAINIGDWIQAITPAPGIQPLANWVTTVEDRSTVISNVHFKTRLGWLTNHEVTVHFPSSTEQHVTYEREVNNSLSTTPLVIGKPLSNLRLGDATALTVQKFVSELSRVFK